ncbi:response regulator [Novosphingobium sp.]|uniref:response regulator n=1 Tax=Novosphingobium sp. TaxID=1874826 RepID=UPI0025EFD58F|nr:response regulator [Novosphingobium sp.]
MSEGYVTPGRRALVVDDNGLVALDTREMLIELGFTQVHVASRGDQALEHVATSPFDWALVDGTLRGGDLENVVAALDQAGVPLAFVSSLGDGSDIAPAWAERDFIARPYGKRELAALLSRWR